MTLIVLIAIAFGAVGGWLACRGHCRRQIERAAREAYERDFPGPRVPAEKLALWAGCVGGLRAAAVRLGSTLFR
jgi:hypothetical protein